MKLYFIETKNTDLRLRALYQKAFPEKERIPFYELDILPGSHFYGVYKDAHANEFVGLLDILDYKQICQVRYLATVESCRGQGIGSKILDWIKENRKNSVIVIDVESDSVPCDNLDQRISRKQFYYRNGFSDSEDHYHWHGDTFDLLTANGTLKNGEYVQLWKELFVLLKERQSAQNCL